MVRGRFARLQALGGHGLRPFPLSRIGPGELEGHRRGHRVSGPSVPSAPSERLDRHPPRRGDRPRTAGPRLPGTRSSREPTQRAIESQERDEGVYLVAWRRDRPIGWVFVYRPGSREASAHAQHLDAAEILDLQVSRIGGLPLELVLELRPTHRFVRWQPDPPGTTSSP